MAGLEVVGDVAGMWQESVQNVSTGLSGLGTGEWAERTQALADALDVFQGTAAIIAALSSAGSIRNTIESAKAAAEASARSLNPLTWPLVAAGLAAGAATGAFAYGIMREHTLKANLSNPSEALATAVTAGVLAG